MDSRTRAAQLGRDPEQYGAYREALEEFEKTEASFYVEAARKNLARAEALLAARHAEIGEQQP
jgi:hypothetical protein